MAGILQQQLDWPRGEALPEREYYVASRRGRRRRRRRGALLPFLLGLALFGGGFLLGRAQAAPAPLLPEDAPPVALLSSGESGTPLQKPSLSQEEDAQEDWKLLLINGSHPLAPDFAVPALTQLKGGHSIDSRVYPALQEMMDAARTAGYQPLICSSFRTWDKQETLFDRKVQSYLDQGNSRTEAEEKAARWVARPGTSEHQAGLAVDIVDAEYQLLDETQEDRPVQQWLMEHCSAYGFILRYPTEKSDVTGVGYEPWHYRYVGAEAAEEIMSRGLCLEEYLEAQT